MRVAKDSNKDKDKGKDAIRSSHSRGRLTQLSGV